MICPKCGYDHSACKDSRQRQMWRWRRYECLACGERFTTVEVTTEGMDLPNVELTDNNLEVLGEVIIIHNFVVITCIPTLAVFRVEAVKLGLDVRQ